MVKALLTMRMLALALMLAALLLWAAAPAQALTYYGIDDGYGYGDVTASGAPFDPYGSTAAHAYIPFGTELEVCGPLACEVVVVNDRCACSGLDVTKGVALRIGLI